MSDTITDEFFFFNDTATTEIYTLSLHDALPILVLRHSTVVRDPGERSLYDPSTRQDLQAYGRHQPLPVDRKSTRLNSSHANISYAVFCLKKKNNNHHPHIIIVYSVRLVTYVYNA